MNNQLATLPAAAELVRQSTDIAGLCKEIVIKSAMEIQGRKYVKVEGWQSIATAHGCIASSRDVERIEGGFRAIGEVRRMSDGAVLATAEGFVGEDEPTWFGGEAEVWDKATRQRVKRTLPKRADYAIRAMSQTRAISRACRSAFAHVVVLMDAGLSTTPAEEIPDGGFHDEHGESGRVTNQPVPKTYWGLKKKDGDQAAADWLDKTYGGKCGVRKTDGGWYVVKYDDVEAGAVADTHKKEPAAPIPPKGEKTPTRGANAQETASQEGDELPMGDKPQDDGYHETPEKTLQSWRDCAVHVRSSVQNKKLGDLSAAHLETIKAMWFPKINWMGDNAALSRPTAQDWTLKACVLRGIKDLAAGAPMQDPPEKAKPVEPPVPDGGNQVEPSERDKLLTQIKTLCEENVVTQGTIAELLAKGGYEGFPEDMTQVTDPRIPEVALKELVENFSGLMLTWGFKEKPVEKKPRKKKVGSEGAK